MKVVRAWKPNLVVHLAAQSSVSRAPRLAEETWRINSVGALNLAVAVAGLARETMVFNVSSGEFQRIELFEWACLGDNTYLSWEHLCTSESGS
jgi:GDP-D-mannose dehydratase